MKKDERTISIAGKARFLSALNCKEEIHIYHIYMVACKIDGHSWMFKIGKPCIE